MNFSESKKAVTQALEQEKKRDQEALAYLYQHFLPGVFSYVYNRVSDRAIAEDLTSEVFLKMIEGIHRVEASTEAGFAAWLFQIARIIVAHYFHEREMEREHEIDSLKDIEYLCVLENDPLELRRYLAEAYCQLTEEQRAVVQAYLMLDMSAQQVGDIIGKNANAVRGLLFRALKSMNRTLSKRKDLHEIIS